MDVKIGHLQSFVAIAQLGSFTRAAKILHVSQPALTVHIRQLEASSDIQMSFLFRDRLSAVFSHEPRLARKRALRLTDLVDAPLILMEAGTSNRGLLERAFQSINQLLKPRYEAARITTALAMAE